MYPALRIASNIFSLPALCKHTFTFFALPFSLRNFAFDNSFQSMLYSNGHILLILFIRIGSVDARQRKVALFHPCPKE